MTKIQRTRFIAAPVDDIWNVLADFGSISVWAANVDHSCVLHAGRNGQPVGTVRRVQVKRDALVERITEFEPPRALAYDGAGIFGNWSAPLTIRARGPNPACVTWRPTGLGERHTGRRPSTTNGSCTT